ncbi:hypothetical protein D3C86_2028210 [compost metagenome]
MAGAEVVGAARPSDVPELRPVLDKVPVNGHGRPDVPLHGEEAPGIPSAVIVQVSGIRGREARQVLGDLVGG